MARTELPNGVILPAEYSDDWYEDMTSNLTKLDDVIGSDSEKLNADGVDFLRMSSAALTNGGTGNFSDLNSSYKIKTGDLVLDSGRKLYQIVSVDSTNETFTVGNSLFKVTAESDLAPVAESGDYDDLDNKPELKPVATSGDYDDLTDLPTYGITRCCSSAITDNSSIAFSAISSTNKIKVGDFLLDINGKMYQITAVDTTNQTVTVGSALIDLALDANVVHTSGNETISGAKYFTVSPQIYNSDSTASEPNLIFKNSKYAIGDTTDTGEQRVIFADKNNAWAGYISSSKSISGVQYLTFRVFNKDSNDTGISSTISYAITKNGDKYFVPSENSQVNLGSSSFGWKSVYAMNYYYGSNNVEFSTKFVTTDTNQSVLGQKVFNDINAISSSAEIGVSGGNNSFKILDKNKKTLLRLEGGTFSGGMAYSYLLVNNGSDVFNGVSLYQSSANLAQLRPYSSTLSLQLGASNRYFSDCYTSKINGLTPSSLGMPVAPSSTSYVDISGYITVLDSSSANTYTPPSNGYITFSVTGKLVQILHDYGLQGKWTVQAGSANRGFIPVLGGVEVEIYITASTVDKFWFIPCQGNI